MALFKFHPPLAPRALFVIVLIVLLTFAAAQPTFNSSWVEEISDECVRTGLWPCWEQRMLQYSPFAIQPDRTLQWPVAANRNHYYYKRGSNVLYNPLEATSSSVGVPAGFRVYYVDFVMGYPGRLTYDLRVDFELYNDDMRIAHNHIVFARGRAPDIFTVPVLVKPLLDGEPKSFTKFIITPSFLSYPRPGEQYSYVTFREMTTYGRQPREFGFDMRDWQQWSGYDVTLADQLDLVSPPDNDAELNGSPLGRSYRKNFLKVLNTLFGIVGQQHSEADWVALWIAHTKDHDSWEPSTSRKFMAQQTTRMGAAYRDWLLMGPSTEEKVPWRDLPGVITPVEGRPTVAASIRSFANAWWAIQVMEPLAQGFGVFKTYKGLYDVGINPNSHAATMMGILPLLIHFAHILEPSDLRTARAHVPAMLSGLLARYQHPGADRFWPDAAKPETWEIRLLGHVMTTLGAMILTASFMQCSEALLRQADVWLPSDEVTQDQPDRGRFTNATLLRIAEDSTEVYLAAFQRWGLREFHTSYTDAPEYELRAIPIILTYAPSKAVYNSIEIFWKIIWQDLVAHYLPSVGDSSAPSERNNGNWAYGIQLQWERFSDLQYAMPLYPPMCLPNPEGCASMVPVLGISGDLTNAVSVQSLIWQTAQATGRGFQPFSHLRDIAANKPNRVVKQHWGWSDAQVRFNFLTPHYSIGTAAIDVVTRSSMIPNVIRLSGMPTEQPFLDQQQGHDLDKPPKQSTLTYFAPNMIVLQTESNDDPLGRKLNIGEATVSWSPPGHADGNTIRLNNHPVITQHQSWQLSTYLAVDSQWTGEEPPQFFNPAISPAQRPVVPSLTTSLLVPLAVDGLWFNDHSLPITSGTCLHFPTWDPVWGALLTVRHRDISVVIRLLLAEVSPTGDIKHAPAGDPTKCEEPLEHGVYPYAVTWRVDDGTAAFGSGRLVIAHRNKGDVYNGTFYSSWLQGVGTTRDDAERKALQNVARNALVTQSTTNSTDGEWRNFKSEWNHPRDLAYTRNCSWRGGLSWRWCPPTCQWNVSARIRGVDGQELLLEVRRKDSFGGIMPYVFEEPFSAISELWFEDRGEQGQDQRIKGSLLDPPITTYPLSRRVNGKEVVFPSDPLHFDVTAVSDEELFQPHLVRKQHTHTGEVRHRHRTQMHKA